MIKKTIHTALFSFCFYLLCFQGIAQNAVKNYTFESIKEGISKVGIYSISQDDFGFIWLATNGAGLYRFDGINYKSYKYKINDSTSLSSSIVVTSFQDEKKRLWFGTDDGLNLYERENDRFKQIPNSKFNEEGDPNISVTELLGDGKGGLFIGTQDLGLFKMNLDDFSIKKIISREYLESESLSINAFQYTSFGKLYVATDSGLKEYDDKSNTLKPAFFFDGTTTFSIDNAIESLVIDNDDSLWIGTETKGLFKVSETENSKKEAIFDLDKFVFSTKQILSLLDLKDGTLLCGTENDGLFHINKKGEILNKYSKDKKNENNILSNSIWSLFLDKNQRIWLGFYNKGVAIYDNLYDKFKEIERKEQIANSLTHESVTAIIEDDNQKLWIATDGGGIDIFDKKRNTFIHTNPKNNSEYSGLTSNYIEALLIDSNKNIWAGSWDKGLFLLKNGAKKFINFNSENTNGTLKSNTILSIDEDNDGIIWIGTFTTGLHSYNPKTQQFTSYDSGDFLQNRLANIEIRKVLVDSDNTIWLGSGIGLFKVDKQENNKLLLTAMRDKLPSEFLSHNSANNILSVFEDDSKNIWIGTRGAGLCKYNKADGSSKWYNNTDGLVEENVNGIAQDNDGNLWLAGNSGITKFNHKQYKYTNYTSNDGLLSNDYNINSAFKDKNGLLYFGNFKGVDYFNPQKIAVNTNVPSLYLTNLKLFNENTFPSDKKSPLTKVIAQTNNLTLNSKQSVFTIEYSTINHTRPEKNQYAYYLEGYEDDWNFVGKKRSATYTNLDAGEYVFQLKASNNDGVWNESPLQLNITILPPWWKTIWAILLYVVLFLLGLYLLNRATKIRLKDKQLVENERNNRLLEKQLNEKKLQFFTNISHEFRTPLSLIIGPLEDIIKNDSKNLPERIKQKHFTIHKNTNRLYRLINELLDFRKLELDKVRIKAKEHNLVAFAKNIISHFKEEAFIKNIHLSIDADLQNIPVWADENMLEKIIFNILSNAFKVTTEGGMITVDLSSQESLYNLPLVSQSEKTKGVEIRISDTGPGLKKDQIKKIFKRFYRVENLNKTYYGGTGIGLEVVNNFVKLHKGKIKVRSEVGVGTTFRIILPTGNRHFTNDEIFTEKVAELVTEESFVLPSEKQIINNLNEINVEQNVNAKTLLIVEDNVELRNYLKNELSSQYKIQLATNGKEGLEMAKKALPDIIMTDVIMPEMDGFTFCKNIKSDLKTSHIPLLMLTAKTTIDNRKEGIENGADAYMVKPFDMGLLKLRLSQLITSRQLIFNKYFSVISDTENESTTSIDKEFIEKVLAYIHKNLGDPDLNVESLASHLSLSRSQFYRKIKALTNQTANEFIRNIRLIKAKQIIETGNSNISEVCYKVGFSSPSYFTKCFKSYFGKLPKEIEVKH